jgi:hypothetical protein
MQTTSVTPAEFVIGLGVNTGGFPVIVDWGDGVAANMVAGNNSHTYTDVGTKTVKLYTRQLDKIRSLQVKDCIGAIPSFAKFTDLETLYAFEDDDFTGDVSSLGGCAKLVSLFLGGNALTGSFPSLAACPNLLMVNIPNNQFSGNFPSFAANTQLTGVFAASNQFTGGLPSFANCPGLTSLSVAGNALGGELPSFAACTLLDYLHAGVCGFTGEMPSFAANTLLTLCDLNHANFTGSLPSFATCILLERFWCNDNQLTGTIPDFAPCTALIAWDGSENGFTGYTAGSFATQPDLITLEFYTNDLPQSAVDAILADLVTSLGIPARAACTVTLQGNSIPSAAGLIDKATLISAGWAVTTD